MQSQAGSHELSLLTGGVSHIHLGSRVDRQERNRVHGAGRRDVEDGALLPERVGEATDRSSYGQLEERHDPRDVHRRLESVSDDVQEDKLTSRPFEAEPDGSSVGGEEGEGSETSQ